MEANMDVSLWRSVQVRDGCCDLSTVILQCKMWGGCLGEELDRCNAFIIHEQETLVTAEEFIRGPFLQPLSKAWVNQAEILKCTFWGSFFRAQPVSFTKCDMFLASGTNGLEHKYRFEENYDKFIWWVLKKHSHEHSFRHIIAKSVCYNYV